MDNKVSGKDYQQSIASSTASELDEKDESTPLMSCVIHKVSSSPALRISPTSQLREVMRPRAGSFSRNSIEKGEPSARKPYHYAQSEQHSMAEIDTQEVANYSRFKYYNKLRELAPQEDNALLIPDHVIPESFFFPFAENSSHRHSSIVTIFALWNTMMGTSLLSMPWALKQTGLALGLGLVFFMGLLCFYTAYRVLTVFNKHSSPLIAEFGTLCQILLGRWAEVLALAFSVLTLLGACACYWILMSNFLYYIVDYIYSTIQYVPETPIINASFPNVVCVANFSSGSTNATSDVHESDLYHKIWNLRLTVPLFLVLIFFPIINMKSASFFTRFNSLGTFSVMYLIIFVTVKACKYGINVDFSNKAMPSYIPLEQWGNFATATGILSMALFIHNCLITIIKNNKNQEKNARDMSIAFFLVVVTYMGVGAVFYITFPLSKSCIQDNMLNNFLNSDTLAVIARACLFFQMTTVFPLLMYIMRVQFFCLIGSSSLFPGRTPVLLLNLVLVSIYVVLAIYLPRIGTIIRFSGGFCGFIYIFTLPCLLYMKSQWLDGSLNWLSVLGHTSIGAFGIANLILQFTVQT